MRAHASAQSSPNAQFHGYSLYFIVHGLGMQTVFFMN